jgi:tetratricopeptide (TPR) repeat protein
MKRFILLTASLALLMGNVSFSQTRIENKKKFYEAEGFILFEEYQDALVAYLKLIKAYPENNNLKFRIGQCYINIPAEKEKAIAYLEEAVQNINPKYKEGKFREKGAPDDAYYYLANAYRINNQLDKALETYEIFNKNLDTKVYNPDVVNLQIQSCLNAKELMKTPLYIRKQNLGNIINDEYPDLNPVVSGDQNYMVYNRLTAFQEALFYVKKVNGKWSNPVNIIPDLGLGQEEGNYATSLSRDGKELYIYRRELDYDGNIYVTKKLSDDKWSNIVRLNENINTKYWESHATVSHDGKKLYFTSNRKDSYGGLDIYVSVRDTGNSWGPAVNLGPVINSIYNEETPFLSEDDKIIFFSSAGHYNMGGYDIFSSTLLENGQWSPPKNAGYPLNTTDDDLFFHPLTEGYEAYYSMISNGGYGLADIYHIEIFSDNHPRKFIVKGSAKIEGLTNPTAEDRITIRSVNPKFPERSVTAFNNPVTGEYEFEAAQGDYLVTFEAPGAEKVMQDLTIPITSVSDTFFVPGVVLPRTALVAIPGVEEVKPVDNDLINIISAEKEEPVKYRRPARKYVAPPPPKPVEKPALPAVDTTRKEPVITPAGPVIPPAEPEKGCRLWYLWLLLGLGIIFFIFILLRKRKKDKESNQ